MTVTWLELGPKCRQVKVTKNKNNGSGGFDLDKISEMDSEIIFVMIFTLF